MIEVRSPEDQPYGPLCLEAPPGFVDRGGKYWCTVEQYLLYHQADTDEQRLAIGRARNPEEIRLASGHGPDLSRVDPEELAEALRAKVVQQLRLRALLLETGSQPFRCQPEWAQALARVRETEREWETRVDRAQCQHREVEPTTRICLHLIRHPNPFEVDYYRRFRGQGAAFDLLCPLCLDPAAPTWQVCTECFVDYGFGKRLGDLGHMELKQREAGLSFTHRPLDLQLSLKDLKPVTGRPGVWMGLGEDGVLRRFSEDGPETVELCPAAAGTDRLEVSRDGRFVVVVQDKGPAGELIGLQGEVRRPLDRGCYRVEHCRYPLAFVEHRGATLLIHATDWNRLDAIEAATGRLLSDRASTRYAEGDPKPEHYLDYFQCGLLTSPDGEWLACNGWVWHPVGEVAVFHLRRWLEGYPWEGEDGPSRRDLCRREYLWDAPLCWVGDHLLAVWGLGEDELHMVDGVRLFDVTSGLETRSFPGPSGELYFDQFLVAVGADGTALWDVATGERLHFEAGFRPRGFHPGSRTFLSGDSLGHWTVSQIRREPGECRDGPE